MSTSKHFDKIAWTSTALMLVITILFMCGGTLGIEVMARTMGYETRLFDRSKVHTLAIVMDNWSEFIDNATTEEYYPAAVVIDGEAYKNVAIRGKGNTSLSSVSSMNSERYSFKIEFDHYDSSISYHGLDKLSLNNLIQDSTMMKDYLTYTMMNAFGATAPLCSFVYITVNGQDWGLYLAVEGVEDSFLARNYGSDHGMLYKPDSMSFGGGRGNGKDFDMNDFLNSGETSDASGTSEHNSATPQIPDMGSFDPSTMFGGSMPDMGSFDFSRIPGMSQGGTPNNGGSAFGGNFSFGGGMGGFGMGSSDVKLQYIDDNPSSYANIWNNAKTDITQADQTRLIESLKLLSNGQQIESVVDIQQVIRYFVVHNYVCNGDSYTGSMVHNYYLYEENGMLAMIPWDYNLAYGTFQGGDGQSTVNTPIDAPISGGSGEDRPMWHWILSNADYTKLYHQYFAEFLDKVDVQTLIDDAYELIKSYVEKDPTAFYTYAEFETGVNTMRHFCALRSESISLQLANGKTTSNMNYVDASGLSLSDMGSMGGGKGGSGSRTPTGKGSSGSDGFQTIPWNTESDTSSPSEQSYSAGGTITKLQSSSMPEMPSGFGGQMPNMGDLPEGFDPSQIPGGMGNMFPGQSSGGAGYVPPQEADSSAAPNSGNQSANSNRPSLSTDGNWGSGMSGIPANASGNAGWVWIAVSVLILAAGLWIAKAYRY